MTYGSAVHSGSKCEKSVAQSATGPVMISLRVPKSSGRSSRSWVKRSSTVMSALLQELDRVLGAVGDSPAGVVLLLWRHDPVAEDLAIALVVVAEKLRSEVVTPAVPLADLGIDVQLHRDAPVCAGPRPATMRPSSSLQSALSMLCMPAVTSALPIPSSRHKCASASGDSRSSISPAACATRIRSAIQSARSVTYSRRDPATSSSRR